MKTITIIAMLFCLVIGAYAFREYRFTETQYRVSWVNPETGVKGHGEWFTDYQTAAAWCDLENKNYPKIVHSLEAK